MSSSSTITALDIGTTKICAIIAEQEDDERIIARGIGVSRSKGITKGIVTDLESAADSIRDALMAAEKTADIKSGPVTIGISGEHIACLNATKIIAPKHLGAQVTNADIKRLSDISDAIVLPPEREIIHVIPRFYSVDGQPGIIKPVGMHANRLELEAHVITGLSTFIRNMVKCVNMAGYGVADIVYTALAEIDAVLTEHEKESGVALIDIGGGTTDIIVVANNRIWFSASIPVGGNYVTRDISIGLRTELDEAENIKLRHGRASVDESENPQIFQARIADSEDVRTLPINVLVEIIEPRMSEICNLILGRLNDSNCLSLISSGVVFTGGGSQIRGLEELASHIFGVPVRIGKSRAIFDIDESMLQPAYSSAVGLALYATKRHGVRATAEDPIAILKTTIMNTTKCIKGFIESLRKRIFNFR